MKTKCDPSLAWFVKEAKRFPILSPEREQALALAWCDHGDREARDRLIGSHLRLVIKIAWSFSGYGVPLADLVGEGNIGLIQAAAKFDPGRGFRFASYAVWSIRSVIREYILHSWSLVKIGTTASQKKLFFNLRRMKARRDDLDNGNLQPETVAAIAQELGVRASEVIEMNGRLRAHDKSLNVVMSSEADSGWIELLPDNRATQDTTIGNFEEECCHRAMLGTALKTLNSREREIVVARRLKEEPATLVELSQRYAVSPQRIHQIEVDAVAKIRRAMTDRAAKMSAGADLVRAA